MKEMSEFPESSFAHWKERVIKELRGAPFESLVWNTHNGFAMEPCLPVDAGAEDSTPVTSVGTCLLHQTVNNDHAQTANGQLLESLSGGANSIGIASRIASEEDLERWLHQIQVDIIHVRFENPNNSIQLLEWMTKWGTLHKVPGEAWNGGFGWDPLYSSNTIHDPFPVSGELLQRFPRMSLFTVRPILMHMRGATEVEELAWALSAGNEYMHQLVMSGMNSSQAAGAISFHFGTGSSFFMEIAKYRAFRILWREITQLYGQASDPWIHASTSSYFQTAPAMYNNLLRSCTQSMSAILGGADALEIVPFDRATGNESQNALRYSRNMYHLLFDESYFGECADAVAGAAYIESMTGKLKESAWQLFLEVEKKGGFIEGRKELESQVKNSGIEKLKEIKSGSRVMVGFNKFGVPEEARVAGTPGRLCSEIEQERKETA